ncbi:MAG: AAA family ATPase [Myxococcales bacterium]|nr:AAA family ATPase [Myxococcales bacterium]
MPIHVVTAPSLRLDLPLDQRRLHKTLAALRPRLLVLDPFVRLHRIDENSAAEVSAVLAFLREVQRAHDTAVLVVHHARKNASGSAGQGAARLRRLPRLDRLRPLRPPAPRRPRRHRRASAPLPPRTPSSSGWSPSATHRRLRISSSRVTPKPSPPPSPAAPT